MLRVFVLYLGLGVGSEEKLILLSKSAGQEVVLDIELGRLEMQTDP